MIAVTVSFFVARLHRLNLLGFGYWRFDRDRSGLLYFYVVRLRRFNLLWFWRWRLNRHRIWLPYFHFGFGGSFAGFLFLYNVTRLEGTCRSWMRGLCQGFEFRHCAARLESDVRVGLRDRAKR